MKHDVILGRKWIERNDVSLDVRRRRLLFPPEWTPQRMDKHLAMDEAGKLLRSPLFDEDAKRREELLTKEDKRRTDGRKAAQEAIRQRITELETKTDTRLNDAVKTGTTIDRRPIRLLQRLSHSNSALAKMDRQL